MTNDEKRKQAVARELDELRKCVVRFDSVVQSARRLATDCRDSLDRFKSIEREFDLDSKIDDLDRLSGRGDYRETLVDSFEKANPDFLGTLSILDECLDIGRLSRNK